MSKRKSTPRIGWGQHSKAYRDRVARQAAERHGLSRRQVRERFNRGTYKPETSKRSPGYIKNPTKQSVKPVKQSGSKVPKNIRDPTFQKHWARIQAPRIKTPDGEHVRIKGFPKGIPQWLIDISHLDRNGYWINPFWYHSKD